MVDDDNDDGWHDDDNVVVVGLVGDGIGDDTGTPRVDDDIVVVLVPDAAGVAVDAIEGADGIDDGIGGVLNVDVYCSNDNATRHATR